MLNDKPFIEGRLKSTNLLKNCSSGEKMSQGSERFIPIFLKQKFLFVSWYVFLLLLLLSVFKQFSPSPKGDFLQNT